MTGMPVLASHGTSYTAITISVGFIFIIGAVIALVVGSYFRLQRHRADAVAMAAHRKLAEDAVANQQELHHQLGVLAGHLRGRAADAREGSPNAVGCCSYLRRCTGFQTTHLRGTA